MIHSLQDLIDNPTIKLRKKKFVVKQKISLWDKLLKKYSKTSSTTSSDIEKKSKIQTKEDSLEFEVENDNFNGIMQVFISHKFVKPDQELAKLLKRQLRKNNIDGYLAEQTREFDIPLNQKIRDKIDASDYLVAIITENSINSPSVHQEIGYAIGTDCPVRIMVETEEVPGVLVKDREVEEFTRKTFEKKLDIIINDILDKGERKKIKSKEFQDLIQNVYDPCYNSIKNEYDRDEFIITIPPNPWKDTISHRWRFKTESDIKPLFENYTKELEKWHDMWIDFGNKCMKERSKLGGLLVPIFLNNDLLDSHSTIIIDEDEIITSQVWLQNCQEVIFNDTISNPEQLYIILLNFTRKKWGSKYSTHLTTWYHNDPKIFQDLLFFIPTLVKELGSKFSYKQIDEQRKILRACIVQLTMALEQKFE